ncbi:Gfo/Idh/MocA family protein [Undibacterium sp. SXout7W]|uniref:Gfo/Idh/MocA family protein n=1 Tax=Undibacterium sp. SXout7W TaxID=3413049 RepID=UPI003BF1F752
MQDSHLKNSKKRISVAGAGVIGQAHIAVIQACVEAELASIVDPSPAAQILAKQAGVRCFSSIDDMLASGQPDAIVLATPNPLHVPQALQCISAGLPVLLEKPVATSVAEGESLLKISQQTGAKILIGHHRAHSPIMHKARQVIASGQLGTLVSVMGSATFMKPDQYFRDGPWRAQVGGGPLLLNMIHEVHNLRVLCGDIVAVQAFSSHATRQFDVEDTVAINLRFANGVLGNFMLSDTAACARSWEQTSQENKAYASYHDEDCYVVTGTNGSLSIPTMRLKTYPRPEDRSWWKEFEVGTVGLVRADPLKLQMEHFIRVIKGDAEPLVTVRDGLLNLRITEAIIDAARTGQVVYLEG